MVLQGGPCGRVDRRRTQFIRATINLNISCGSFLFLSTSLLTNNLFCHTGIKESTFNQIIEQREKLWQRNLRK